MPLTMLALSSQAGWFRERVAGPRDCCADTGRSNQLTRQNGEHLVTAELGRRGFIATPFCGNVPSFDRLVANEAGFCDSCSSEDHPWPRMAVQRHKITRHWHQEWNQKVLRRKRTLHPDLVCILVVICGAGKDEFYTLQFKDLQDHFFGNYRGGKRGTTPVKSQNTSAWNSGPVTPVTAVCTLWIRSRFALMPIPDTGSHP